MAKHVARGPDNFSEWHRCKRWTERGLTCPFRSLEKEGEESEQDAEARPSGAQALQAAVGQELATTGVGFLEILGPLLALFTVLRGVQTLGPGLKMGRVQAAGVSEEATVRVLRPQVPAKEGPRPSKPTGPKVLPKVPANVPMGRGTGAAPRFGGGGGGFFVNQAAMMRTLLGRK